MPGVRKRSHKSKKTYSPHGKAYRQNNQRFAGTIMSKVDVEWKHTDTHILSKAVTLRNTTVMDDGAIDHISPIAQNTTETGRIGKKCRIKKIMITGAVGGGTTNDSAASHSENIYDLYLVMDKQTNGVQMLASEFAQAVTPGHMFKKWDQSSRFTILKFKRIQSRLQFSSTGIARNSWIEGEMPIWMEHTFAGAGLLVNFTGIGNTISDIQDKSFHLVLAVYSKFGTAYPSASVLDVSIRTIFQG